jgi:hypothetical protein
VYLSFADVKQPPSNFPAGPFVYLDVVDRAAMAKCFVEHKIDWVIHLASLLSAVGERNPQVRSRVDGVMSTHLNMTFISWCWYALTLAVGHDSEFPWH